MLNNVMTIKEASERWGLSDKTVRAAISGQKGLPPRFKPAEVNKSAGTWLIMEDAMMRLYGLDEKQMNEARNAFINEFGATMVDEYTFTESMNICGEEKTVLHYIDAEVESLYVDGRWLSQIESKVLTSDEDTLWVKLANMAYDATGEYPTTEDVHTYEHGADTYYYNDLIAYNEKTNTVYTADEFSQMVDDWNEDYAIQAGV